MKEEEGDDEIMDQGVRENEQKTVVEKMGNHH